MEKYFEFRYWFEIIASGIVLLLLVGLGLAYLIAYIMDIRLLRGVRKKKDKKEKK